MKLEDLFEAEHKTLYCSRDLLNGEDLVAWAHKQGFKNCLTPDDMHVTIAYSKKKIDWSDMTDSFDTVVSRKGGKKDKTKRAIKAFGEKKDAIVLTFESDDLHTRWEEFKDEFGASWDHDGYHPHVTITYDGLPEGLKLEDIEPYEGELRFGPEKMAEVNNKWKSNVKEKKINEGLSQGRMLGLAAPHQNNIYDEDDLLGGAAEDWTWRFEPALPISYFLKAMSADEWKNHMDFRDQDGEDEDDHASLLRGDPINDPVVVVERDGHIGIWDGWHRVASSFISGRTSLPAIIGTRKAVTEAAPKVDVTQTPAFKHFFRNSKVVDKAGKPLIVYHGTASNFRAFNMKKQIMGTIWFTSDKSEIEAGNVGAAGSGKILELYASIQNPAGWDEYDKLGIWELKGRGYDGVILPNRDGSFHGICFEPTQLKSATKNNGNFDRFNKNLNEDD